ncbi:MAG: hypothetical protein R2747_21345 [Pyrinomonadaceae bacterium]
MTTQDKSESFYQQQIELSKNDPVDSEEEILKHAILRLNGQVVGIVLGLIGALVIFVATNWLVLKGGEVVGPHLGLLDQFFIGYSVTFVGSLVGALYGFIVGYVGGLLIGWIYNAIVFIRTPKSRR